MIKILIISLIFANPQEQRWLDIESGHTLAWARHITGQDTDTRTTWHEFKSIATIHGKSAKANGDIRQDDEVWVVVDRGDLGTFIEQFQALDWGADSDYCWFVDCGWDGSGKQKFVPGVSRAYPVLQELTDDEIPDTPDEPADTTLVGAISVTTAIGLQSMTPGNHYSIDADIDLTGVDWTPLDFDSADAIVIEGNGNTISNLSIDELGVNNNQALIGTWAGTGGGEIRNLNFTDCSVTGDNYTGILIGEIDLDADVVIKNINFTDCNMIVENIGSGVIAGIIATEKDLIIYGCTATDCTAYSEDSTPIGTSIFVGTLQAPSDYDNYSVNIVDCNVVGGSLTVTSTTVGNVGTFCTQLSGGGTTPEQTNLFLYNCNSSADLIVDNEQFFDFGLPEDIYNITQADPGVITMLDWPTGLKNGDVVYIADVVGMEEINSEGSGRTYFAANCNQGAKTLTLTFYLTPVDTNNYDAYSSGGTLKIVQASTNITVGGFSWRIDNARLVSCSMAGDVVINSSIAGANVNGVGVFCSQFTFGSEAIDCYATGEFSIPDTGGKVGLNWVGGFVGLMSSDNVSLLRCYSTGDLIMENAIIIADEIGGFAGTISSFDPDYGVERCWSTGDMTFAGGILETGNPGQYIGSFAGIIGNPGEVQNATVADCYAWGSILVTGDLPTSAFYDVWIGGFVGQSFHSSGDGISIDNAYCAQTDTAAGSGYTEQIPDETTSKGFGGWKLFAQDPADDIFYDTETSGMSDSGAEFGVGHITDWMQTQANYEAAGWDFDTIWHIPPGEGHYETIPQPHIPLEVCVYADGVPLGVFDVNEDDPNDILGLDEDDYDVIIAGINYYSIYESFPLELGNDTNIHNVAVDFYESLGCNVGVTFAASEDWLFSEDNFATRIDMVTEIKDAPFFWGTSREPVVYLWEWDPIPLCIRAIIPKLEVTYD